MTEPLHPIDAILAEHSAADVTRLAHLVEGASLYMRVTNGDRRIVALAAAFADWLRTRVVDPSGPGPDPG